MYSATQLFFIYSGLFFGALVFALITNSVFMRFFRTFGIREGVEGTVRWAASQKPAFGGIGFFIIFLGAFAVHGALFPKQSDPFQPELLGLLAATGLGFLMGLADDAYNTRPLLKFTTQIACGVILIASGSSIHVFQNGWVNHAITLLWVVGMMNSINMLDNMDAITTVTAISILACGLLYLLYSGPSVTINVVLVVGIIASLCGFLFFNWNPSRMYMGDTGSQFLGVFLAYVGIRCFWNGTGLVGAVEPWRQAVSTLVVFALPIADTTVVTINRIARGGSPFVGGKDHTTHYLSYAGLSDAQVALVFSGLGALSFFFVFAMLWFIPVWQAWHSVVFIAYFFTLFGFLFGLTRRTKAPEKESSLRALPQEGPPMKLIGKVLLMVALLLGGALCLHLFTFSVAGTDTDLEYQRQFNERYRIFSLNIPSDLTFCGEPVPIQKIDVRERLDRELLVNTYWQSNSLLAHKRANRWFPVIEPILAREGVPDDLKYIALIESGLTNVVSPMGATGYWQFMKETGMKYGLDVNAEVDERYNVVKSTEAACKYLKENYAKYGSWAMAGASYNLGPGGLDKQVGRQKSNDYFSLLLPEETSRYVFRVLAMKAIITDPERYGFHLREKDLYPPYRTRSVTVTGPVEDLNDFAVRQGSDYKTLKLLNPWLRDIALTNPKGHNYELLLPGDGFDKPVEGDE